MITLGMLVKNCSNEILEKTLKQAQNYAHKIIIIDDGSTDSTVRLCSRYTKELFKTPFSIWEKNEKFQRERLFNCCLDRSNVDDWIFILDYDEHFVEDEIKELKKICSNEQFKIYDGLNFSLFDMWSDTHYRSDVKWNAHTRHWTMAVRKKEDNFNYEWKNTRLHCGRFPLNACENTFNTGIRIKHMGWANKELRKFKHDRYLRLDKNGTYGDLKQYKSIIDENPNLIEFKE